MNPTRTVAFNQTLTDARALLAAGDITGAGAKVGSLLKDAPDAPDALLLAAEVALADRAFQRAAEHLDALEWALAERGSKREAGFAMTERRRDADDRGLDTDRRAAGWALRVRLSMAVGRMDAAAKTARELTDLRPRDVTGWRLRAMVALAGADWTTAREAIERWTMLAPRDPEAWRMQLRLGGLADDEVIRADALAGLAAYSGPGERESEQREARALDAARHYHHQARYADALAGYEQLAEHAGGDDPALVCEAADVMVEVGDLDPAAAQLLEALAARPTNRHQYHIMRRLAGIRMFQGRVSEAGRWWWRIIQMMRCDRTAAALAEGQTDSSSGASGTAGPVVTAWAGLWVCAAVTGRAALADRCEQKLSHSHVPEDQVQTALMAAWSRAFPALLIGAGRNGREETLGRRGGAEDDGRALLEAMVADAEQTLADAAEHQPHFADIQHHLAVCREHLDDLDGAQEAWTSALLRNPGYREAARGQFTLLLRRGDHEAAKHLVDMLEGTRGESAESGAMRAALHAATEEYDLAITELAEAGNADAGCSIDEVMQQAGDLLERADLPLRATRLRRQWAAAQRKERAA